MRSTAWESHVPLRAHRRELPAAVDLLGHVGQVEVGGEGAHELDGRLAVELRQQSHGGLAVGADQPAHVLDQVEQLAPLLALQGAAEQDAELADVVSQAGVPVAHPANIRGPNEIRTSAPPPGALAASTLPPCASAAWRTMASPRPEPGRPRASRAR